MATDDPQHESSEDLTHDDHEFGEHKFFDLDGNENHHLSHSHRIRRSLADNTAELRVLADRYTAIMAEAQDEIDKEEALPTPSQFKIEALTNLRDRAEEKLAKFKAGPDRLPSWLTAHGKE